MENGTPRPISELSLADFTTEADVVLEVHDSELIVVARREWALQIPDWLSHDEAESVPAQALLSTLRWLTGEEWLGCEAADYARELSKATDHMSDTVALRIKEILTGAFRAIRVVNQVVDDLETIPVVADYSAEPDMVGIR